MADGEQCREEQYAKLEDLRISLDRGGAGEEEGGDGEGEGDGEHGGGFGFSLCVWIYLSGSARPSSIILKQKTSECEDEAPFLVLNEENKLILLPLILIHKEAPSSENPFPWTDMFHTAAEMDCPLEKWFHVGCQVAENYMRLHVDGKLVGEKSLFVLSSKHCQDDMKKIILVGNDGNLGGYIYHVQVLPISASVSEHFVKNPPAKLSLDNSCILDGVEEGGDGVWSIVGGKASCRRNFSLEVVLLDAFGRSVHREMEVVASLLYADSGTPVEKTRDDAEAPLLTSCDGLEYPSTDRPVMLLRGRATYKLKISQLSSKCDNRLFRVCFHPLHGQRYPFLEAYSCPIRCISRNRSNRTLGIGKRSLSTTVLLDEIHLLKASDGLQAIRDVYGNGQLKASNQSDLKCSPQSKHFKVEDNRSTTEVVANGSSEQRKNQEMRINNFEGTDSGPSDSESTDLKDLDSRWSQNSVVSDVAIFRYCLESTFERSMILKQLIASASNEDIANFAEQVCLYSGCSHHRNQILVSKHLVQEGDDTWNSISRKNQRALWMDAISEINNKFMMVANSASRPLSGQDLEILRGIAGCGDDLGREEFDRMWYWLYPVAFALSKDRINRIWKCLSPKWIEGFITKEEGESALKGPGGLQKAGTFVLRFPTSRSWPHPDAGSLIVAYVGTDCIVHHRLLSLDHRDRDSRLLQDLLLEEPELSQLGRVVRQNSSSCAS
ncbi:SH2 domain-containing protein A-like isoform X1 [Musa acuminata AAA Group]|uniref:SH2 domain-containing protein A-like isoform X1 n=1 Tax=Musa acuminata AAA Group TaxID=214697 RepID=UPI0031D898C7